MEGYAMLRTLAELVGDEEAPAAPFVPTRRTAGEEPGRAGYCSPGGPIFNVEASAYPLSSPIVRACDQVQPRVMDASDLTPTVRAVARSVEMRGAHTHCAREPCIYSSSSSTARDQADLGRCGACSTCCGGRHGCVTSATISGA